MRLSPMWQNCLFSDSSYIKHISSRTHSCHPALSSHLPTPAVYGRTLHIHGPLVFENLSPGLFHLLRTEPSDWLTNKPDTSPPQGGRAGVGWGGWRGHLLSLPQHPHVWAENKRKTARHLMPAAMKHPCTEHPLPPPHIASTYCSLSFAWVKPSQTPGLVFDLPPTSAGEGERASRKVWRVGGGGAVEERRQAGKRASELSSDKSGYGFMT